MAGAFHGPVDALVRYDSNGSLDSTFGSGGVALLPAAPLAVAVQTDGKIVVASNAAITRYNADGSIDTGFGVFGSAGSVASVSAIAVQGDGRIVAAGTLVDRLALPPTPVDGDFALIRYNTDGSVDESFGAHGGALADFFTGSSGAAAFVLAIQSSGAIVVAGQVTQGTSPSQFAVARFTSQGTLDPAFGTAGVVTSSFGGADSAAALVLQTDGKIVAAGNSVNLTTGSDAFAVARYTAQ